MERRLEKQHYEGILESPLHARILSPFYKFLFQIREFLGPSQIEGLPSQ